MKTNLLAAGVLCLGLLSTQAQAESASSPDVHVGDRWAWQHINGMANEKDYTLIEDVVEVSATEIRTRIRRRGVVGNVIATYSKEWNPVDMANAQYDPYLKRYSFPLHAGASWDGDADKIVLSNHRHGRFSVHGQVESVETVTVPAGTFQAYKVVVDAAAIGTNEDANVGMTREIHWYAPQIKHEIRMETSFIKDGRVRSKDIHELIEYRVQ